MTLNTDQILFSYKKELVGRGRFDFVLMLYLADKEVLIKLQPTISGFSTDKLNALTVELMDVGVKEIV
jgi:hypothetical protein